ncbi:MAG: hypothetical protein FWG90_10530 [Oscillospiraceae bacterium]|nr:hypothetical protein [Oscillospiraceae bacterium]
MRSSNRAAASKTEASRKHSYKAEKLKLKKKKSNPVGNFLKTMAAIAFIVWCAFSFVSTQSEIAGKRSELDALKERTYALEQENEEYLNILSEENERDFMERIAIDALGYAYPNERRFIDTTRN